MAKVIEKQDAKRTPLTREEAQELARRNARASTALEGYRVTDEARRKAKELLDSSGIEDHFRV